jgi:pimeloyl-ACP methyl ester carboxylesterase
MSQGGYLSLRLALTAPARVLALVLIDTQAAAEPEEKKTVYQQMLDAWSTAGPVDHLAQTIATIIIDDPKENEIWIAKWKERRHDLIIEPGRCLLERDDISSRLGEIKCPALVIHGTKDSAISMDSAKAMAKSLSGCKGVVEIAGAAHASNLTHPHPVNAALLPFLRSIKTF